MSERKIKAEFPGLKKSPFFLTSPESPHYNCIAWAAGDSQNVWWPHPPPLVSYWPPGVARTQDLQTFIAAFATLGYAVCADGTLDAGFEKVALFADAQGKPTHAAKQLPNGRWSSKLGLLEDIDHILYSLEGAQYGKVVQYLIEAEKPHRSPRTVGVNRRDWCSSDSDFGLCGQICPKIPGGRAQVVGTDRGAGRNRTDE